MKQLILAAAAAVLVAPAMAATPDEAMAKAGCMACHAKDKKLVGPGFNEIAAKYKGQKDIVPTLMKKVRAGGAGNWGQVPMTPNPADKINDADLKAAIEQILKS